MNDVNRSCCCRKSIPGSYGNYLCYFRFACCAGSSTCMFGRIERKLTDAYEKQENLAKFPSENPNPVLRIAKDGKVLYSNKAGEQLLSKWNTEIGKISTREMAKLNCPSLCLREKHRRRSKRQNLFNYHCSCKRGWICQPV